MPANDANISSLLQVISELNGTIQRFDTTVNELREVIKKQDNLISEKDKQIKNLEEAVEYLRRNKYGSKSEHTRNLLEEEGQLNLFNELELEENLQSKEEEPVHKDRKRHAVRNPKSKRFVSENLPVKEILLELTEEEAVCEQCGTPLKPMGKRIVRECIQYIPPRLEVVRYVSYTYECPRCKHTDHPYIIGTVAPSPILNHSLASATSVANIIYQKYVNATPLYRQEKYWQNLGVDLSRTTMANWMIRCTEEYFKPLVERLRTHMLSSKVLYCDETPVQVLKEEGRTPQSKSYMWLYTTGKTTDQRAVIYDYHPSRAGKCARDFLEGFSGYLHTDGYAGYNQMRNVIRCSCWAHVRRKFFDAAAVGKTGKGAGVTGLQYCDKLFDIEKQLADLSPEERYIKRLELEKPVLEAFWSWLNSVDAMPKSKLGGAVQYAMNQKDTLENYLLDGRCSISNNLAENAIRPFTVGRKNWLFADTAKGAQASAAIYSLVESAKANNLDVYKYFCYILNTMPDLDWHNDASLLDQLMPWSAESENCKLIE